LVNERKFELAFSWSKRCIMHGVCLGVSDQRCASSCGNTSSR